MGITYNPGSGLRNVPEIKINPNGTLRNVIEVWENVGGVLKQVWPDTAYDGSHFAGELRGGVLTNIFARDYASGASTGHEYYWMNNITANYETVVAAITSGGLYRNITNNKSAQEGYNTLGRPFGFVSSNVVDFTKVSKVTVTGSVNYSYTMSYNASMVDIRQYLTVEPIYKSGDRYVRRSANAVTSGYFGLWDSGKINEYATASSGNIAFSVTLDISAWTTTDYIGFYFDPSLHTSIDTFSERKMNLSISRIEFTK